MLVTTPFTAVRLLSCHCRLFQRLYHLVLDEADQLFARAPDQVRAVYDNTIWLNSNPQTSLLLGRRFTTETLRNNFQYIHISSRSPGFCPSNKAFCFLLQSKAVLFFPFSVYLKETFHKPLFFCTLFKNPFCFLGFQLSSNILLNRLFRR